MAKIYFDEIEATISSSLYSTLKTDSTDSSKVDITVSSFINDKEILVGPQWDKVRGKFGEYQELLSQRAIAAEILSDAIKEALQLLRDYLGDDLMLDSSMLVEYQNQRNSCQGSIDRLYIMLNEKEEVTVQDDNGKISKEYRYKYDQETIKNQIAKAEEILKELDRLIEKIQGLDDVCQQAISILQPAFSAVDGFAQAVSGITPSSKVVYSGG